MNNFDNPGGSGGTDKRTIIAIAISFVLIFGFMALQPLLFPTTPAATTASTGTAPSPATTETATPSPASGNNSGTTVQSASTGSNTTLQAVKGGDFPVSEKTYTIQTDRLIAVLTNKGGDLISLKLKQHLDGNSEVDLVNKVSDLHAGLSLAFGTSLAQPETAFMKTVFQDDHTIAFEGSYAYTSTTSLAQNTFTLTKKYTFKNGENMWRLEVSLENSVNEYIPLDFAGDAYTLEFGPQIGPMISASTSGFNADYRKFITLENSKKKDTTPKQGIATSPKTQPLWVGISGKYFAFIVVPEFGSFKTTMEMDKTSTNKQSDSLSIGRPAFKASKQTDLYHFYFGPKTSKALSQYDFADRNTFGKSGLNFAAAADDTGILSWLEWLLKTAMNFFYGLIPNYGISIILVTILVKIVFFPLTRKSSLSSAKMQELQPKMKEIQEKYKDNPKKLNQELAEFYKREGFNPMSGCLPLLIQFPIFIAMYNLFNNHFELRGALFIPGWIPDLSQPDVIIGFNMVDLGIWQINALRGLPIIYVISQLFYGKFNQMSAGTQSPKQMKFFMYGLPLVFFFILYNTPSGLLIYWIISNVLTIGQQIIINDYIKKKKALAVRDIGSAVVKAGSKPSATGAGKPVPAKPGVTTRSKTFPAAAQNKRRKR